MTRLLVNWRSARGCWALLCWAIVLSGAAWAGDRLLDPANEGALTELRVKAAYLYKFGAFVRWPDQVFSTASAPVVIGILDADMVADELAGLISGRMVQGRPIAVRRLQHGDALAGVHVLFIGRHANGRSAILLAAVQDLPVLTVTDQPLPAVPGSIINFVNDGGRVRFDVFMKAADKANLGISARLLAVARRVEFVAP